MEPTQITAAAAGSPLLSAVQPALAYVHELSALLGSARRLTQSHWKAKALARIVALTRDLEFVVSKHPAFASPNPSGWLAEAQLCLAASYPDRWAQMSVGALFERLDALPRRWRHHETKTWTEATAGGAMQGRPGIERTLAGRLAFGDLPSVRRDLVASGRRSKRGLIEALHTGVAVRRWSHGLDRPRAFFMPPVTDPDAVVSSFSPTAAMVAALASGGPAGWAAADAIIRELSPAVRPVARAWLAVGCFRGGNLDLAREHLASVVTTSARDVALVEFVRYGAQRGALDDAGSWERLIHGRTGRALASTHIGLAALSQGDLRRAKRYQRRALEMWPQSPEAWLLAARMQAKRGTDYASSLDRAFTLLRAQTRRKLSPIIVPATDAPPTSVGLVVREMVALWMDTGDASALAALPKSFAAECVASPDVLRPVFDEVGNSWASLSPLVAGLPSRAHALLGDALVCTQLLRRADALDAGRALASLRSDSDQDAATCLVFGALAGAGWSRRPTQRPLRLAYEEGRSLAPNTKGGRKALYMTARRCLLDAMSPDAPDVQRDEAVASMRILTNLGGTREQDFFYDLSVTSLHSPLLPELVSSLSRLAPKRVLALLWQNYLGFTDGGRKGRTCFETLEGSGGTEAGWTAGFRGVLDAVRRQGCSDVHRWWHDFAGRWWEQHQRPMTAAGLAIVAREATPDPAATVARFQQRSRLPSTALGEMPSRVLANGDLLVRLQCSGLGAVARVGASSDWWRSMFSAAQATPQVARNRVQEVLEALGRGRAVPRDWEPPALGFAEPRPLPASARELRLLSKRNDMLAYLRLTESVPCCLSNAGRAFPSWQSQRVALLWRDPLSFAFQVERVANGKRTADGFVFGCFGLSAGRVVLLLNGLYLNRQTAAARAGVLDAIEAHWARPLGAVGIGVAARHGGSGPLPARFSRRAVRVRRSFGLVGKPSLYDDLGLDTLEATQTTDLFWTAWGSLDVV